MKKRFKLTFLHFKRQILRFTVFIILDLSHLMIFAALLTQN